MKKLISVVIAVIMGVLMCSAALATTVTPTRSFDMESDFNSSDIYVGFDIANVTDKDIAVTIYAMLCYDPNDITALQEGDTIETADGEITVKTIEAYDDVVYINFDTATSIALFKIDDDTGFVLMAEEYPCMVPIGEAVLPLADTISINSYEIDADGNDHLVSAEVAATDLNEALTEIASELYIEFDPNYLMIHFENDTVTDITIY